jgi:hypothetical protein
MGPNRLVQAIGVDGERQGPVPGKWDAPPQPRELSQHRVIWSRMA